MLVIYPFGPRLALSEVERLKSALTQIHFRDVKSAKPLCSKQKSVLTQIDIFQRGDFIIISTQEWDLLATTVIHFFTLPLPNANRLQ